MILSSYYLTLTRHGISLYLMIDRSFDARRLLTRRYRVSKSRNLIRALERAPGTAEGTKQKHHDVFGDAPKKKGINTELSSIGERNATFPLPHGRGDNFHHGSSTPDPRELPPKGLRTRDIYIPGLHIDAIRVKTRDFR